MDTQVDTDVPTVTIIAQIVLVVRSGFPFAAKEEFIFIYGAKYAYVDST